MHRQFKLIDAIEQERRSMEDKSNDDRRLAFQSDIYRDLSIQAYYIDAVTGTALVQIMQGSKVVREFHYPSYKIWNLEAHAQEILDSELNADNHGYEMAGADLLGGCVMPSEIKSEPDDTKQIP